MKGDSADDVVEWGSRRRMPSLNWRPPGWRPPNWRLAKSAATLLAVGLVIGLAAGYVTWHRQTPRSASPPAASRGPVSPAPAPALVTGNGAAITGTGAVLPGGPALTQDTGSCSAVSGRTLQLGVQVTNGSSVGIGLGKITTVLPLGGLRVISQQWAPCGAIGVGEEPAFLGPGDSTWFSVTLQVLVSCPGPLPVEFTVGYTWAGKRSAVNLPGFPDLSQVSYPDCKA